MKIFGYEIFKSKKDLEIIEDEVPEVRVVIPNSRRPSSIPRQKDPTLGYHSQRRAGRGAFQTPEYNLGESGRVADTDSFVRQAFDKKTALMFKEGWDLVGKNPKTIKYIKLRLAQISQASNMPIEHLFRMIGSGLVTKSNAFIVKARKTEASGGKVRRDPSSNIDIKPIAGYFIVPAETMEFRLSGHRLQRWRQLMPDGETKEWNPKDIIHFYYARKEGFIFGTPLLIPVIDDIRALRKIEENIELLVYQHLFPLFQYKVGTEAMPAGITETGEREIDIVRREIQFMPTEGGIVTPERHEVIAIGAEGRALNADKYLEHFKKRVFSGLGVSAVDLGEGNTSNRACYSEDTETLTDSGFKNYWEITQEDKIATYNPKSNSIEFQYPNGEILLYEYNGKMIRFNNRNVDTLVTPDHDMWVGNLRSNQKISWEKISAENIDVDQFKFKTGNIYWEGEDPEDFLLPYIPSERFPKSSRSGPYSRINVDNWLEFLGYYVSEGSLAKTKDTWRITISENSIVNKEKTEKIRSCLLRLPFKFSEYTNKNDLTTRFWINCKSLYLYLEENCGDYNYLKHFPLEILRYNTNSLKIAFEAAMLRDRNISCSKDRTLRSYFSTSDILIDQIQEIAIKLGYSAYIFSGNKCNRVSISIASESNIIRDDVSIIDYSGMVYCFNVPNHLFITRRNGRIGIHGNTADNMSRNLVDAVKDIQQVVEIFVNEYLIKELLLESTFGDFVLDEENLVFMKFKEIDVDSQIKKENHAADLFMKDSLTQDEARRRIGHEPIMVPTPEEIENGSDSAEQYPEWNKTRWKLFREPELLIQAVDEQFSPAARAIAKNNSISATEGDAQEAIKQKNEQEISLEKEKTKNKIITKKPTLKKEDGFLESMFIEIKKDIVSHVSLTQRLDYNWVSALIRTQMNVTTNHLIAKQVIEFRKGYASQLSIETEQFITEMAFARRLFRERSEYFITKLTENIIVSLKRNIDADTTNIASTTRSVFEAVQFRTNFIEDVEVRKARNFGIALGARDKGISSFMNSVDLSNDKKSCAKCISKDSTKVDLLVITLDDVPPHHPGCSCSFKELLSLRSLNDILTRDGTTGSADNPDNLPDTVVQPCPECGKTAIKTNVPDSFKCKACNHIFVVVQSKDEDEDEDDVEDRIKRSKQAKYRRCKSRAKARLKSRDPTMDDDQLEAAVELACIHLLDMINEVDESEEDATLDEESKGKNDEG